MQINGYKPDLEHFETYIVKKCSKEGKNQFFNTSYMLSSEYISWVLNLNKLGLKTV